MVNLRVRLGRLELKNPILLASGTAGYAHEMAPYIPLDRLGGVIPKTVTRDPRKGNPPPRTVETPSGLLNSIGLDNDGLEAFLTRHLPELRRLQTAIIVNIAGRTDEEFVELARQVGNAEGVAALELNLSCPNVSGGVDFAVDPARTQRVVADVCAVCPVPVIAKLTPNVTDVVPVARAAADGGADAVSLVNTFRGLAIDWRRRRPVLGAGMGGLSGPAIKPLALGLVWQVASALDVPVIGIGGISSLDDCLEFLLTGARAVQIGTANFFDPALAGRVLDDLPEALRRQGLDDVNQWIGALEVPPWSAPADVMSTKA